MLKLRLNRLTVLKIITFRSSFDLISLNQFALIFFLLFRKNPFHNRVLMIDEAIWDTSFVGNSILETMIFILLQCRPNPKKVSIQYC